MENKPAVTLPPVPTPPRRIWFEIRLRIVPVLLFIVTFASVVLLWKEISSPSHFFGEVETVQTRVSSPDSGLLANLWVANFQEVKAGMPIAELMTTDPRTANNRLSVMRGRMQLTELEMSPILIRQRSALDYERMAVDCEKIKVDLALARVNLDEARSDFQRQDEMFKAKLISPAVYDRAVRKTQLLQTEVEAKTKLIEKMEATLERLVFLADSADVNDINDPVKQALEVEAEKVKVFEEKMKPLQLHAPIDGIVTFVHRRSGEQVIAGEPIVTITGLKSERIVGHVPSSSPIVPKVGMKVEVTTRLPRRQKSLATIIGVGPHVGTATNAAPSNGSVMTRPVSINLPADLTLLPGEPVDLRFVLK